MATYALGSDYGCRLITIEENKILFERAATCQNILQLAGDHADEWDSMPEGLLTMMLALVFACGQYKISHRELVSSIKKTRDIIMRAQAITGTEAPLSEIVFEAGVN